MCLVPEMDFCQMLSEIIIPSHISQKFISLPDFQTHHNIVLHFNFAESSIQLIIKWNLIQYQWVAYYPSLSWYAPSSILYVELHLQNAGLKRPWSYTRTKTGDKTRPIKTGTQTDRQGTWMEKLFWVDPQILQVHKFQCKFIQTPTHVTWLNLGWITLFSHLPTSCSPQKPARHPPHLVYVPIYITTNLFSLYRYATSASPERQRTEPGIQCYAITLGLGNLGAVLAFPFLLSYGGIAGKTAKGVATRMNH